MSDRPSLASIAGHLATVTGLVAFAFWALQPGPAVLAIACGGLALFIWSYPPLRLAAASFPDSNDLLTKPRLVLPPSMGPEVILHGPQVAHVRKVQWLFALSQRVLFGWFVLVFSFVSASHLLWTNLPQLIGWEFEESVQRTTRDGKSMFCVLKVEPSPDPGSRGMESGYCVGEFDKSTGKMKACDISLFFAKGYGLLREVNRISVALFFLGFVVALLAYPGALLWASMQSPKGGSFDGR